MSNRFLFFVNIALLILWIIVGILNLYYGPNRIGFGCVWITLIMKYFCDILMYKIKKE